MGDKAVLDVDHYNNRIPLAVCKDNVEYICVVRGRNLFIVNRARNALFIKYLCYRMGIREPMYDLQLTLDIERQVPGKIIALEIQAILKDGFDLACP